MADREFLLRIVADVGQAQKSLGKLETDVSGFKETGKKAAVAVGGFFAADAVLDFGKSIVSAASDTEQAIGASQSVFKEYGAEIETFSQSTAKNMGLSQKSFLELATVSGALLKNAGLPLNEVADSTEALTGRAADLAAMFGGDVSQAMDAINAALKGEADPIEKYGISLKAAAIEQKAVAMGMVDAEGKATDYGKTQARIALIMEQSADAAGTFKKESKSLAGQQAIMGAQWQDLQADLGQKLLPVIVTFANTLRGIIEFVSRNQDWLVPLVAGITAIVVAIKLWTIAQAALNIVMTANPIGLIVVAVVGLIAAIVALYMKVDWFREFVDKAIDLIVGYFKFLWEWVKKIGGFIADAFNIYVGIIKGYYGFIWDIIQSVVGLWRNMVGWITSALSTVWNVISWPFKEGARLATWYIETIISTVRNIYGWIQDAIRGVAELVTYPFRIAFDAIKRLWNNTIGGFGFSIPSWVPGVGGKDFRIPHMAAGGIVTRPTVALIGEAGPEAVIPLGAAGGLGSVTINVYALTANAEVGRRVVEALREYERTSGAHAYYSSPALATSV